MRRGAGRRYRRPLGQGVPNRAHGPRQRADGDWYAGSHRDGVEGAEDPARIGRRAGGHRLSGGEGRGLAKKERAMEIDWSGRSVETPELTINYARAGKGAPIVFLHGWPEFNRTWLHNMPVLAD